VTFSFRRLLAVLAEHEVEFMVVDGLAGVLQGAPINTKDVDIIYSIRGPNPARLLTALLSIGAIFRDDPRNIVPNISHLVSSGHKLLTTSLGDLDCLGTIEESTTYEDLQGDFDVMELDGVQIRVISLPRLVEVKKKLTRPKDKVALVQLEATLAERLKG
jgi:hypothetical protein